MEKHNAKTKERQYGNIDRNFCCISFFHCQYLFQCWFSCFYFYNLMSVFSFFSFSFFFFFYLVIRCHCWDTWQMLQQAQAQCVLLWKALLIRDRRVCFFPWQWLVGLVVTGTVLSVNDWNRTTGNAELINWINCRIFIPLIYPSNSYLIHLLSPRAKLCFFDPQQVCA